MVKESKNTELDIFGFETYVAIGYRVAIIMLYVTASGLWPADGCIWEAVHPWLESLMLIPEIKLNGKFLCLCMS